MSKIEWTERTWNPSIGCDKVSAGCKNCYADVMAKRLQAMGNSDYKDGFKFRIIPRRLDYPVAVKKPSIFFVNSMSDLFHEDMPYDFLDEVFSVMKDTPHHIYQILTKRAHILSDYCRNRSIPRNVFLGVTVENRKVLHRIETLRAVNSQKFLSIEPLLEDLGETLDLHGIDWVIVGGESGNKARPMNKIWVENIFDQCRRYDIPFFFKQWGTYNEFGVKKNKKANGRLFKNREWSEMPQFYR